jgi:hypothetical protein
MINKRKKGSEMKSGPGWCERLFGCMGGAKRRWLGWHTLGFLRRRKETRAFFVSTRAWGGQQI